MLQISAKEYKTRHDWVGRWSTEKCARSLNEQVVYVQPRIYPRKWDAQSTLGIWDTNGSSNPSQMITPGDSQQQQKKKKEKKKRTCRIADFDILVDFRVKIKEKEEIVPRPCEKTKKKNKLWSIKMTVIPDVIGALGKIPKGLFKGLEDMEISYVLWILIQNLFFLCAMNTHPKSVFFLPSDVIKKIFLRFQMSYKIS